MKAADLSRQNSFQSNPILTVAFPNRASINSELPTYMCAQTRKCQMSPSRDSIKRVLELRTVYTEVGVDDHFYNDSVSALLLMRAHTHTQ